MVAVNGRFLVQRVTGAQRYASEIVRRLGNRVRVVAPRRRVRGLIGHAWEQAVLPFRLKRGEVLWSPSNTGPLASGRHVLTILDTVAFDHPEWLNPRFVAWYRWLLPRLVRRVRHLLTISEFSKARLIEQFNLAPEFISVVPCGVDERFVPRGPEAQRDLQQRLGIAGSYVLCLGSIEPRKNLPRVLRVWRQVEREISEDTWLIVAGGTGTSRVFQSVALEHTASRVRFLGYVADRDLPVLYSGALAFVYPSEYEGFGLPPLEAMACGTPVLTGNTTALPEVVGDGGVMIDVSDDDTLRDAILALVREPDLRARMSRKGLARAARFSWSRAADMTWGELEKVATRI